MRLQDKVAIVTGGASGIGAAMAERFAQEGAAVLIADINDVLGPEIVTAIEAAGGRAVFMRTDVTRQPEVQAMVEEAVSRFGKLDVLVNNVGATAGDDLVSIDEETWDWNFNVVLKSAYLCSKAALPHLLQRPGGNILNVSSVNGMMAIAHDAYNAAKAGMISLTQSIAVRYGPQGLRANVICPGTIDTPIGGRPAEERDQRYQRIEFLYPLRRVGRPAEVANAALFLVSDEASFVTGAVVPVDGGLTAGTDLFRRSERERILFSEET